MTTARLHRHFRFPICVATLALTAILSCAGSAHAGTKKRVVTEFTASLATIVGTPFGLDTSDQTAVVSGFFIYDPDTVDTNPNTQRGDYQQAAGYFEVTLPGGSKITGSATPFAQVEDFSSDTFRFIDGPRTVGNQGGTMALDGIADGDIQLFIAISGPGSSFADDSLPDPLPFGTGNIPTHTFSLKEGDTNDTALLQFVTMTSSSSGITVTESGGSTAVTEGGANDQIEVALTGTPVANVTVTLTPGDTEIDLGNGDGVAVELTFTPGNANTPQPVTVSAKDDSVPEGAHATDITITASSTDPVFDRFAGSTVTVAISDNGGTGETTPANTGGSGGNSGGGSGNSGGPTALEYLQTGAQAYQLFTDAGYNLKALAVYYYFVYFAFSAISEEAGDSASAKTYRDAAPSIFTTLWNMGD